jgi:alanyl-tRNA synthetase
MKHSTKAPSKSSRSTTFTSSQLRSEFLKYFQNKGHTIVSSSPLVPANDPTLLFTNAGMVQFKDVFLGQDVRPYSRAATSQRCMRAGGKHNDLENVGYTARHHTFFEMLGNFSFGDYFKRDAIAYCWEFLTSVLHIPAERLWVTVFEEDDEAADIWLKEIKVDPTRFSRCGASDNFWSMGDTGPCGPCTEVFYDHGPSILGGPPGSVDQDGDRYVEIWNLVFMQYDRNHAGELKSLPKPSVDTGMGLERLAAVMQGVHSNYDTDVFIPLIKAAATLAKVQDLTAVSLRVIADHIRACSFLIADGVIPSNEGRGYVLRRIIRRAVRHGAHLGLHEPFFYKLVKPLVKDMGDAYPELVSSQSTIERFLLQEEQQFAKTLQQGLKLLDQDIANLSEKIIPGATLFRLYDTYGFPVDLTADIARERGLQVDYVGFEIEMDRQRRQSQETSRFVADYSSQITTDTKTDFTGYESLAEKNVEVTGIFQSGNAVNELAPGSEAIIVLDRTPFYAESGGQVGDKGSLKSDNGLFEVMNTRKEGAAYGHYGKLTKGRIRVGDKFHAQVDVKKRRATALNHSATHLLNAALRVALGNHVQQKGSLVEPERLRFDFSHFEPLKSEQIKQIERLVNQQVQLNYPIETEVMPTEQAMKSGAVALFGEKYGENVRVLKMGEFSKELCGGTHAKRTGDIGLFKITTETGIAAGVRRIEAVTGEYALDYINNVESRLNQAGELLKGNRDTVIEKLEQLIERARAAEKQVEQLRSKVVHSANDDLLSQVDNIAGINVVAASIQNADAKALRYMADKLKDQLESAVVVLATVENDKISLVASVTKDCSAAMPAGELINFVAMQVGGKGGGRPDMAQAGGDKPEALTAALKSVFSWVRERV